MQLFLRLAGLLVLIAIAGLYFWASHQGEKLPDRPAEYVEEAARATPVTDAERAERERRLYSVFEGALADSKNGDDILLETPGYYKLLQTIANYTPEEITAKAVRPLSYAACRADPDGWRGEFVWARGVIAGIEAVPLDRSAYGIRNVYRGVLSDGDGSRGILFDLPVHPGERPVWRRDAYDVEGIFYRLASWETKQGQRQTDVPWLIVRNLRPVAGASDDRKAFLASVAPWVLGAMALVVAVVLGYALRRGPRRPPTERRQPESIREMFARRLDEEGHPPPPPTSGIGPPPTS
jgi:hypothetical protein